MGPLPTYRGNTWINLLTFAPTITASSKNQLPENALTDSEEGSLANQNQLSQSLKDSLVDTVEDDFANTSLTEIPTEMKPVQMMN